MPADKAVFITGAGSGMGRGLMFSTSSSSGTYGMPRIAVYSAIEHVVKGLTEALSVGWNRLKAISPEFVRDCITKSLPAMMPKEH